MKPTLPTSLLVCALVAGLTLAARITAWPLVSVALPGGRAGHGATAPAPPPSAAGESTGEIIGARDPFRVTRRPAPLVYDPLRVGQPPPPPVPKPTLVLAGIVWDGGASPTALVEGIIGIEGPRAVRKGEVVGDLRVKDIRWDRVVIAGSDTVWTLTVKEPWK